MPKTILGAVLLLITLTVPALAGNKPRTWKTGKLLDADTILIKIYNNAHPSGSDVAKARMGQTYSYLKKYALVIEGEEGVYAVSHALPSRRSKMVQLTVNGPVKYAVDKDKFYLIDETGKEFKLKIDKMISREQGNVASP